MNKAILIGRIGKEVESKKVKETTVANFSLATNKKFKQGDETKEITTWHNIVVWGSSAEFAGKYLSKGDQISVIGEINTRSYETNGEKKYITEIVASELQLISKNEKSNPDPKDNKQAEKQPIEKLPF